MKVTFNDFGKIATNGLRSVISGLGSLAVAWLVIKHASASQWGEFVPWLVGMGIVSVIVSWGNKEYLLRQFSLEPNSHSLYFYGTILWRIPLFFLLLVLATLLFFNVPQLWYLMLWGGGYFLYQSLEAWMIFRGRFSAASWAELVGLLIILIGILLDPGALDLSQLCLLYACSYAGRLLVLLILVRLPTFSRGAVAGWTNLLFYRKSTPFLVVVLIGLLASKMDLYVVSYTVEAAVVGPYQILVGALGFVGAVAGFIAYAFIGRVYQMDKLGFKRSIWQMSVLGLLVSTFAVLSFYVLFRFGLDLSYSTSTYLVAILYCWPPYVSMFCVLYLYQQNKERLVIRNGIVNAIISLVLALILLPRLGITGGLVAGFVGSATASALYLRSFNRI